MRQPANMPYRFFLLFFFALLATASSAQLTDSLTLISWNIRDFGRTKSDTEMVAIARILRAADVVAIQEVVAGYGGAQAVARLADELNRMGSRWDYRISDPTDSPAYKTERYAILWKPSRLQLLGRPTLVGGLAQLVYREPYLARFRFDGREFFLLNYHSRRYDENPQEELGYLVLLAREAAALPLLIAGDFNMSESDVAFLPLYQLGYAPALRDQPTTLKRAYSANGSSYLHHAIDNVFYNTAHMTLLRAAPIDFVGSWEGLATARQLSDHLPVRLVFGWRE